MATAGLDNESCCVNIDGNPSNDYTAFSIEKFALLCFVVSKRVRADNKSVCKEEVVTHVETVTSSL